MTAAQADAAPGPVAAAGAAWSCEEEVVRGWLDRFAHAVACGDVEAVAELIAPDGWWRDLVALTWDLRTAHGRKAIVGLLSGRLAEAELGGIAFDPAYRPTRSERFDGAPRIDALYRFRTRVGGGRGVVRLVPDGADAWQAEIVTTSLETLNGFEETVGRRRPRGDAHRVDPSRETWAERVRREREFADADPYALVVGAGHAGLSVAARLAQLEVPTLVVERNPRVGDNWRNRYRSLVLHDPVQYDHLPYLPFPETWPTYTPKDKAADWLESYAGALDLHVWTSAELRSAAYDESARRWVARVVRDGAECELRPAHVVFATGITGPPVVPELPGRESFAGTVVHASAYTDGRALAGRRALVVGAGNSGFDIARDLYECGATVTLLQRSSTYVMSVQNGGPIVFGRLYGDDAPPTDQADLLRNVPYLSGLDAARHNVRVIAELDRELLDDLTRAGFALNDGEEGAGNRLTALRRAGGYVLDVGCAALIASGDVTVRHGVEIARLTNDAVVLSDGSTLATDAVILATGYANMRETARAIVGDAIADRCTPVWGLDEEGELNGVFRPSGQPALWFAAGGFADSRFYSLHLALQLKARQVGILDVGDLRSRSAERRTGSSTSPAPLR